MAELTEMVYRRKRRKPRMMDGRRFILPLPTRTQIWQMTRCMMEMTPGFLLAMADVADMPSGLYAAYIASMAALDKPVMWPSAGACAAVLLRLVCGLDPRWETLLTIAALLALSYFHAGRSNLSLMGAAALALLPMGIVGWMAPTARSALMASGGMVLAVFSTPVICRGLRVAIHIRNGGSEYRMSSMEDRLSLSFLILLIISGGARLLVAGMNTAMLMSAFAVIALAMSLGSAAGCAAGIVCGIAASIAGLPMMHAVVLGCSGFLAGVMRATGRRWLVCLCFCMAGLIVMICAGVAGTGCSAALVTASAAFVLIPAVPYETLICTIRRLVRSDAASGDAYAACMLLEWERTVDALALSVPTPSCQNEKRDAAWWTERLCDGCASSESCGGIQPPVIKDIEAVWDYREAEDDVWFRALEGLRGLGCQRLYHLQQSMDDFRSETARHTRAIGHAQSQRSMLVTHLTALSGAARRFAHLSLGESWWDTMNARRIRSALSDAAAPVSLMWLRRVEGHVQAVFTLEQLIGARRQAEELCELVSEATGVNMMTVSVDVGRVRLSQRPPMKIESGSACACAKGQELCGDTAMTGMLADGRFLAVLSDGMGHGEKAAMCSRQTAELMRLCLDAGYTLKQAMTAVNGMMLLGDVGERFITADVLTIDLWTGRAVLDKLGAADTWLMQKGTLSRITADALPLGILEDVDPGEHVLSLHPGDALVLLTDGAEDAFPDQHAMQEAMEAALGESDAETAAKGFMQAAARASDGLCRDDMTVVVLRLEAVQA